eukprot:2482236-Prymnesium_polylepis.3
MAHQPGEEATIERLRERVARRACPACSQPHGLAINGGEGTCREGIGQRLRGAFHSKKRCRLLDTRAEQ